MLHSSSNKWSWKFNICADLSRTGIAQNWRHTFSQSSGTYTTRQANQNSLIFPWFRNNFPWFLHVQTPSNFYKNLQNCQKKKKKKNVICPNQPVKRAKIFKRTIFWFSSFVFLAFKSPDISEECTRKILSLISTWNFPPDFKFFFFFFLIESENSLFFSLIGKVVDFQWIPWFPWLVGTLFSLNLSCRIGR